MLGYDELNWRCYRIYDPKTLTVKPAIHVTFDETVFPSLMDEMSETDIEDEYYEVLTPNTHILIELLCKDHLLLRYQDPWV